MRRLDSIRRSIVRAQMRVGVSEERAGVTKQDYLKDVPDGDLSYRDWLKYQEEKANLAVANLIEKAQGKDVDFRKIIKDDITYNGETFYAGDKRYKWIRHGVFIDLLNLEYEEYIY